MISPPLIAVCGSMSIHVSSTPAFLVELAAREPTLPDYVQREFEDTLACGRLERGFLRVRVTTATPSGSSPSVANAAGSARVVADGGECGAID